MRRKLPQGYRRSGSSNPLSMGAFSRRKDADPLASIRDGAKQEVQGRANKPTERQKDAASWVLPHQDSITAIREGNADAMDYADAAFSLPGLALAKPLFKGGRQVVKSIGDTDMGVAKKVVEGVGSLLGKGKKIKVDATPRVGIAPAKLAKINKNLKNVKNPKSASTPPPNPNVKVDATPRVGIAPAELAKINKNLKNVKNPKPPKPPKTPSVAKRLVPPAVAAAVGYGLGSNNNGDTSKKQTSAKNKKLKGSGPNPSTAYRPSPSAGTEADLDISPGGKTSNNKSDPTEDGRYKSYSKDNNDFMYMTQKGYDEMMDDSSGEKAGGRPGRGKMKTQGMNKKGKRKAGFSGRGSGAALRGF